MTENKRDEEDLSKRKRGSGPSSLLLTHSVAGHERRSVRFDCRGFLD
jgi:hypothetical protein